MTVLAIVLTFVCMALMFLVDRGYKIAILFMSTMLLSMVFVPGGIRSMTAITLCFLLSEVFNIDVLWRRFKKSMMLPFVLLTLLSLAISVVNSPNIQSPNPLIRHFLSEDITCQFAVVYAFLTLRGKNSIRPLLIVSMVALLLMTIIAYDNLVSGYSFFMESLYEDSFMEYDFASTERFRVQATFLNPFDYGYMCVLLALLHLYGFHSGMESPGLFAAVQICCFFGVVTCGCRTVLFCYMLGLLVYVLAFQKSRKNKLLIFASVLLAGVAAYFTVPVFRKSLLSIFSIFDLNSAVRGSSLAMRVQQFMSVLSYVDGYYLFGRGIDFFTIDLGWENGASSAFDSDLYGLEGIYLEMLLERGIVGFAIFLATVTILLVSITRNRFLGRKLYALGMSVFVLYIAFIFMTGELMSTTPTYYVLGYVIANLDLRRRYVEFRKRRLCPASRRISSTVSC